MRSEIGTKRPLKPGKQRKVWCKREIVDLTAPVFAASPGFSGIVALRKPSKERNGKRTGQAQVA